jgi:hypothetical protein
LVHDLVEEVEDVGEERVGTVGVVDDNRQIAQHRVARGDGVEVGLHLLDASLLDDVVAHARVHAPRELVVRIDIDLS